MSATSINPSGIIEVVNSAGQSIAYVSPGVGAWSAAGTPGNAMKVTGIRNIVARRLAGGEDICGSPLGSPPIPEMPRRPDIISPTDSPLSGVSDDPLSGISESPSGATGLLDSPIPLEVTPLDPLRPVSPFPDIDPPIAFPPGDPVDGIPYTGSPTPPITTTFPPVVFRDVPYDTTRSPVGEDGTPELEEETEEETPLDSPIPDICDLIKRCSPCLDDIDIIYRWDIEVLNIPSDAKKVILGNTRDETVLFAGYIQILFNGTPLAEEIPIRRFSSCLELSEKYSARLVLNDGYSATLTRTIVP